MIYVGILTLLHKNVSREKTRMVSENIELRVKFDQILTNDKTDDSLQVAAIICALWDVHYCK